MVDVDRDDAGALTVTVTVESATEPMGCPACGVLAHAHGRREVRLVDAPAFGRPTTVVWRKRRWRCPEPACPVGVFSEQDERVARPRALLTVRACRWAIAELGGEHASVQGLARRLGTTWRTVWTSIEPILATAAADESRFEDVTILGVDEHVWHHVSTKPIEDGGRGPKELTGMADLTRDQHGRVHARLLDLVPGRSGETYKSWLHQRGDAFRARVEIATLDPFHGYKNAIDDQLQDARSVLDAFHVVKLATQVVYDVRRRVQQDTTGHRGRRGDPLYRIRNTLRAGQEHLTDRQRARLTAAFTAREEHLEVELAWRCAQQVRSAYHQDTHAAGRAVAETIVDTFATCPIPEVARLGKTLRRWRSEFLGYFDTNGASNGGTEAVNGLIELHRRIARGFRNRDNYRLRMLLIAGGLRL
ncbi:ISL3 family transposase [Phycicoccus sp. BSK3Z-2]|uniref:ISL3 family transposase n=1 Tax=Phycicoccus avicenniae TaxID=2828860 RepID=A0A941D8N3_9MICO|nr:ISL3 family transposase [Phycicoccus avicenniae]